MTSEIWWGQLGEVRPWRREGPSPGQHFENTKIAKIPPQRCVHLLLSPFYR